MTEGPAKNSAQPDATDGVPTIQSWLRTTA